MDFKLNLLFSHKFVLNLLGLIWTFFFSLFSLAHEKRPTRINFSRHKKLFSSKLWLLLSYLVYPFFKRKFSQSNTFKNDDVTAMKKYGARSCNLCRYVSNVLICIRVKVKLFNLKLCELKPSENITSQYCSFYVADVKYIKINSSMPCNHIANSYVLDKVKCHFWTITYFLDDYPTYFGKYGHLIYDIFINILEIHSKFRRVRSIF